MFGGGGSIQLARIFGIRIGIDWSWFIALFLIISLRSNDYESAVPDANAFVLAVISALLLFLSILLHELGHAVVAIRNGIPILGIELMIFGGVARLGRDSGSPGVEFRVAAAGPLVTLLIALFAFGLGALIEGGTGAMMDSLFLDHTQSATTAVLGDLALVNVALLLFNLIPAFPLDGGRIARAIAWKLSGDRNRATRFAAWLGRVGGWLIVGAGVALFLAGDTFGGVWLAVIGFFLSSAARSAHAQADFAGRIEHIRVADVMDEDPVAIREDASAADAEHAFFLRYGWPWFPVVDSAGRLVGVVSREAIESVPVEARPTRPVSSLMARDDGASGLRIRMEEPLENLLGQEGLARLGAMMAVDGDGVLRGIVTVDAVRRALQGVAPA